MSLPINIEDLLNKRKVESNRIEFKGGWNPSSVYRSICAFANDIDNIGGGYILIGVSEENGVAKRPVNGIPVESLDRIQKEMHQFNQMIEPFYAPRISVEDVDGKCILVIWVTSGHNRPYTVPFDVKAKLKKPVFYIRYGTSSIEAEGEFLDQLRDMANRVPFDDRGNETLSIDDISPLLLLDYLKKIDSRLANENLSLNLQGVLEQMELLDGPIEKRTVKNVAAMMFCEKPDKFFKMSQVEIVMFPEGRVNNPDNFIEVPPIKGPVPKMIADTLNYLRTNVIKERIRKQANDEHSVRYFNYPYSALEEAVVNALYHRDYQEREPVEITIEPDKISILSYSGPDRSISMESIQEAQVLRSRRYRNRRLGEFLKELDLTEGRATGIPTIQKKLKENGSGKAIIETDEARTYFMMDIPCHPDFIGEDIEQDNLLSINNINDFEQVVSQVVSQVKGADVKVLIKVLQDLQTPLSLKELMAKHEQTNRTRFKRVCLDLLLQTNLVQLTIPEKPNSKLQKYVITEKGRNLLHK